MYTKRQPTQQQQQLQPPPPPPPAVVGIAAAPRWTTTSNINMEELSIHDDTPKSNNEDCDRYAIIDPFQQHHHQQQHPSTQQRQHQTLYVYLSGLLQRIGQSASPVERYRSLQELYAILSSSSQSPTAASEGDGRVEMLLNHHGDSVLCWQLAYATQTKQQQQGGMMDVAVLALLLECLALIWTPKSTTTQSSSSLRLDSRVQSMKQAANTTLPILLQVGDDFPYDVRIQKPLLFILRLYTKIRDVPTKSMLIKSGLVVHLRLALERLWKQFETAAAAPNQQGEQEENSAPWLLGLMKDLLFRAESTEKQYMYEEWQNVVLGGPHGMMGTINQSDKVACAEAVSACLWNWAVSDDLARRMAQRPVVWETLHCLLSTRDEQPKTPHLLASPHDEEQFPGSNTCNRSNNDAWSHVHRNALAALGTMIASCTVTTRSFNNETMTAVLQEQTWLIPCLSQILDCHEDKDSRRRCIRTLRCLSSCAWGRAFLVRPPPARSQQTTAMTTAIISLEQQQNHNHLLTLFLRCLQRQDEEVDTRIQASLAIAALLPSCHASEWMAMGPYFETALVQTIEDADSDKLVLTATQALQVSLDHSPWKRGGSGCFSVLFFESSLRVLRNQMSEPRYHSAFASLILHLVNRKKSTGKSSTILICAPVAELLSTLLTPLGPDFEASRSDALQAIVDLTTATNASDSGGRDDTGQNFDNRNDSDDEHYRKNLKTLAANEGLLNNLVNLCLIAPTFKDQAKRAILKLVPEL